MPVQMSGRKFYSKSESTTHIFDIIHLSTDCISTWIQPFLQKISTKNVGNGFLFFLFEFYIWIWNTRKRLQIFYKRDAYSCRRITFNQIELLLIVYVIKFKIRCASFFCQSERMSGSDVKISWNENQNKTLMCTFVGRTIPSTSRKQGQKLVRERANWKHIS